MTINFLAEPDCSGKAGQTPVGFAFLLCLHQSKILSVQEIYHRFVEGISNTGWLEFIAVFAGFASVWFSRIENILVYPVGLINTIIYIYLSFKYHLPGEATVNLYYTIMSIYGWILWSKRNEVHEHTVVITRSTARDWRNQLLFFAAFFVTMFATLSFLKKAFSPDVIPFGDSLATAAAFTGMWLMARKKVESWYWWILTNLASIPLYFVKGLVFTSVFYLVLLVMAVFGLIEWQRRAKKRGSQP